MSEEQRELRVLPIPGLPEIEAGANLGEMISALAELHGGDVLVIAQKAVSKAEDRVIPLSSAIPGAEARRLAAVLGKEPNLVQLILDESKEVLRAERNVLITETHHGLVCANAGIDTSNLPGDGTVCLLPEDPDASARRIRNELKVIAGVVISDSFGRAWRLGQAEVAIGCSGLTPLDDWRGREDAHGQKLEATMIAVADEVATAADLARSKDSQVPAVIVRGLDRFVTVDDGPGAMSLRRPPHEDLFR
jgi:coenzyme F420-0:L-glutamate ligase/coenzyme F420-1:gamma-L-glutamate ligase